MKSIVGGTPKFITYLWAEGTDFYAQGLLNVPKVTLPQFLRSEILTQLEDVTIVWADDGSGIVPDRQLVKEGHGLYYHTAMLDGKANQLTEMVPPSRIYDEIGYFIKKGMFNSLLFLLHFFLWNFTNLWNRKQCSVIEFNVLILTLQERQRC